MMLLIPSYIPSLVARRGHDAAQQTLELRRFDEIERRYTKVAGPLRAEARLWRDMAAAALGRS